jgi:hypothetical protein
MMRWENSKTLNSVLTTQNDSNSLPFNSKKKTLSTKMMKLLRCMRYFFHDSGVTNMVFTFFVFWDLHLLLKIKCFI